MDRELSASVLLVTIAANMQPDALIGAIFGAAFFMMLPFIQGIVKRAAMSFLSVGAGYYIGIAAGAPHIGWAAIAGAALSVIILTSAANYFSTSNFADIIGKLLDIVRTFK